MKKNRNKFLVITQVNELINGDPYGTELRKGRVYKYDVEEFAVARRSKRVNKKSSRVGLVHKKKDGLN